MANLTATFVLQSDRYADQSVLAAGNDNITSGEDNTVTLALPSGFGDVLLLDLQLYESSVVTGVNYVQTPGSGLDGFVVDLQSNVVDFLGAAGIWTTAILGTTGRRAAYLNPESPILVREQSERIFLNIPYSNTDAGNTSDWRYYVRVRRLRQ